MQLTKNSSNYNNGSLNTICNVSISSVSLSKGSICKKIKLMLPKVKHNKHNRNNINITNFLKKDKKTHISSNYIQ